MAFTKKIEDLIKEDKSGLLAKHDSWERVYLRDVADVINGYAFKSSYFNSVGNGIALIRIRDVVTGKTETYYDGPYDDEFIVNNGDFLVGMDGDFNCAYWRSGEALLNQRVCKIAIRSEHYHEKLLAFALPHYLGAINEHTSSMTVKHLSSKTVNEIRLPLPPKNEQARIVEKLEELLSDLDDGVAELQAAQIKLTQYRQALLKSAVEGSLTEQWRAQNRSKITETGEQLLARTLTERRERWEQQKLAEFKEKGKKPPKDWQKKYPEPVQPEISELPTLPDGWVWASVDQCTFDNSGITDGPFGSNLKTSHYTETGPRVIRLQNIGDGIFHEDKAHISESHYQKLLKHAIETGDTVVAMMGDELPRACRVPEGVAPGIVKADCARVRVNQGILNPELLPYYLNSQPIRARTKSLVKGIGRPRINLSHIRGLAIPIAPMVEQQQILERLKSEEHSVSQNSTEIQQAISRCGVQRINILKDAFSGNLVEQVLTDEPANILLKKIQAQRAERSKQPKRKRLKKTDSHKVDFMDTLLDILKNQEDWMDAQAAFRACGVTDGTDTDRIEELYSELRRLDKDGILMVRRQGNYDMLKLKGQ